MRLTIFLLVSYQLLICQGGKCFQEQPLCLTVNLTTLLNVCKSFFKVPCPKTCGVCAAERVKLNFLDSIDPNTEHRIGINEAQIFLRDVNITLDEALVTEINELLMDSKAILTDMFNHFDLDKNEVLNLTEVFKGFASMLEMMGVKIKTEFKESVSSIAEMIRISNSGETFLPKLSTLLNIIMKQFDTYPHGLISLNRVQNMTNGFFNLERVVVAHQLIYSINIKVLTYYLLTYMDIDNDGFVGQAEYTYAILNAVRNFNVTLSQKAEENLVVYFDIYQSSVESIMNKYGIKESGLRDYYLVEGMILSEYEDRPFVNLVIPIHESVQSVQKMDQKQVPRYVRSSANTIPPRKLTALSIIEVLFGAADKNRDGIIDVSEFAFFTVNSLPKQYRLSDMNESLKVLKLYDDNNDDRLNAQEFKQLFRPVSNIQAILNTAVPAIARLII